MSSLSEFTLFKQCVEKPCFLDKSLSQLNLQFIKDPAAQPVDNTTNATAQPDSIEVRQRKALRLFYMIWSGITKCMRNIVQSQKKALEIPDFAIFGPISETNQGRDPLDKGIQSGQRNALQLGISPVFVVLNDDLLNQMNWEVSLDQTSEKAVGRYNKNDRQEVNDLFKNRIQSMSISSIASVCCTDNATVDLIIKEILATICECARRGRALRLNFKVGYLIIQNQLVQWQHSRDLIRHQRGGIAASIDDSSSHMPYEESVKPSQAFSVMTPSVARFSRATSTDGRNHHMSNPNPQKKKQRYYGARDNSNEIGILPNSPEKQQADLIKFGKRVNFGGKVDNDQLLQDHLREMRQNLRIKKAQRSMQMETDNKYLARVADRDQKEAHMKMRSSEVLKNEFLFFNDQKQIENKIRKDQAHQQAQKDKLDFFPFVSGELLDQHRQGLSVARHSDMRNYMVAKSQAVNGNIERKYATPGRLNARKSIGSGDNQSVSSRLTKASTSVVKALHDSCYVQPTQNPRVIQESDPVKQQAWKAALDRHESQITNQKKMNEGVLKSHYERISDDVGKSNLEQDSRKQKQQRFFEEIRTQIDTDTVRKKAAKAESKELVPTSFGPSEDEDIIIKRQMAVHNQKSSQKRDLGDQIQAKRQIHQLSKDNKIEMERNEIYQNTAALEVIKEKKQKVRNDTKEFWSDQMQLTNNQRQKELEARDVLKKPNVSQ